MQLCCPRTCVHGTNGRVAKRAQHVAPNNFGICCVKMLRLFGQGFQEVKFEYNVKRLIVYLKSSESVLWYWRHVHGFRKHWRVVISIDNQYFNGCSAIHRWNALVFGLRHDEQRVMYEASVTIQAEILCVCVCVSRVI